MDLGRLRIQSDGVLSPFVDDLSFGGCEKKSIRDLGDIDKDRSRQKPRRIGGLDRQLTRAFQNDIRS